MRRPLFLLVSLVATATLSVGACGPGGRTVAQGGDDATKAAVKVKQLWSETKEAREYGKLGFKVFKKGDPDLDGIATADGDNCPTVFNRDQANSNTNSLGDACDDAADYDIDGVEDAVDNCTYVVYGSQVDLDEDGEGDACDDDMDGDGL